MCVDTAEIGVCEHLKEAYFPSESTPSLSGEINANTGGEEGWRSEGMTTKDWEKPKTNKGLNSRKERGEKKRKQKPRGKWNGNAH